MPLPIGMPKTVQMENMTFELQAVLNGIKVYREVQ